jgi:hypothetical protein
MSTTTNTTDTAKSKESPVISLTGGNDGICRRSIQKRDESFCREDEPWTMPWRGGAKSTRARANQE